MEHADKTTAKQLGGITGKGFMPGQSGNPLGRPKGSISIKDKVRQYLEDNPSAVEEMVRYFVRENRELTWQMLDGRPAQQQDATAGLPYAINVIQFKGDIVNGNLPPQDLS